LINQLQAQAERLGCHNKLHFTGLLDREAVASALAEADLLLMPSEITENFGLAAVEAMASGVPVLVSEGIPAGRWAEKARAGRAVACDSDTFQQAALGILSSLESMKLMGQRGKDLVRDQFDVRAIARQTLAQYESIIMTGQPLPEVSHDLIDDSR
jgi:glycosyltransferase involved in cell wall biosynthesis